MKITGVTPEHAVAPNHYKSMRKMGVEWLRMINVLNGTTLVDDKFVYDNRLYDNLNKCDLYSYKPHIIIGQFALWFDVVDLTTEADAYNIAKKAGNKDLADEIKSEAMNRIRNEFDWKLWAEYINSLLTEVCIIKGFAETRWEVGNEMPVSGKTNWLVPDSIGTWDLFAYEAYQILYWYTAKTFIAYKKEHPDLDIKLGGWASPVHPWLQAFAVQNRNTLLDFIGIHVYASSTKLGDLDRYIKDAKQYNNVDILVSEFGYNGYPVENNSKLAYTYSKAFLACAEEIGINEAYALMAVARIDNATAIWKKDGLTLTAEGLAMMEQAL